MVLIPGQGLGTFGLFLARPLTISPIASSFGILQISPLLSSYGIETTVACLDEPDSEWLINKPYNVISLGKGFLNYGFLFGLVSKLTSLAKNYDLVIDPELVFSTYSGSSADNFGYTATYDKQGNLYAGSISFGPGYPTTLGAYQLNFNGGVGNRIYR